MRFFDRFFQVTLHKSTIFVWGFFVVSILVSLLRIHFTHPQNEFSQFINQKVIVSGHIVEDPKIKTRGLDLEVVPDLVALSSGGGSLQNQKFSQKILVSVFGRQDFAYGNQVFVMGKLKEPQPLDDFDYPDYLHAKNIFAQMQASNIFITSKQSGNLFISAAIAIKHFMFAQIREHLPKDPAEVLIAIISGEKSGLTGEISNSFNLTGTAHMIAVSGYKLTIVVISLESFALYIGRKKTIVASLLFCWIYAVMAAFAPAVMRAVIMSGMFVVVRAAGRPYNLKNALLVTASLLMLASPFIILYDVGFLLSVIGILGIIYFGPYLQRILKKIPHAFGLKEIFISTTAAQFATFPIMLYFFHQISPIALVANVLVVPLLAPCVITGYFVAVPFVGQLAAFVILPALNYLILIVEWLVRMPFAYRFGILSGWGLFWIYLFEISLLAFLKIQVKRDS